MAIAWTRHPFLAGLVGVFAGALAIALTEWLAHQLLGPVDLKQPGSIGSPMFASVLVAWVLGAGTAARVASAWHRRASRVPGLAAAGVLMSGSVVTLFALPHPTWMIAGALLLMPAAAWLGSRQHRTEGH